MDTVITHARNADVDFEKAGFVGIESRSVPRKGCHAELKRFWLMIALWLKSSN
jgi:hypothetical protein